MIVGIINKKEGINKVSFQCKECGRVVVIESDMFKKHGPYCSEHDEESHD